MDHVWRWGSTKVNCIVQIVNNHFFCLESNVRLKCKYDVIPCDLHQCKFLQGEMRHALPTEEIKPHIEDWRGMASNFPVAIEAVGKVDFIERVLAY